MQQLFWQQKWENRQIGFHEPKVNPLLTRYIDILAPRVHSRICVPLCGKTLDIAWLLSMGYRVVGIELVELAVEQLFEELGEKPTISKMTNHKHYHIPNLDLYVGDVFQLSEAELGPVEAVYDRAAFVALPEEMRTHYVTHLAWITKRARQLLISCEYDPTLMQGPPFSFEEKSVSPYYQDDYELTLLACEDIEGGLKGHPARQHAWMLNKRES